MSDLGERKGRLREGAFQQARRRRASRQSAGHSTPVPRLHCSVKTPDLDGSPFCCERCCWLTLDCAAEASKQRARCPITRGAADVDVRWEKSTYTALPSSSCPRQPRRNRRWGVLRRRGAGHSRRACGRGCRGSQGALVQGSGDVVLRGILVCKHSRTAWLTAASHPVEPAPATGCLKRRCMNTRRCSRRASAQVALGALRGARYGTKNNGGVPRFCTADRRPIWINLMYENGLGIPCAACLHRCAVACQRP
jgi:hypothetical protein